jgi:hypothetical protein
MTIQNQSLRRLLGLATCLLLLGTPSTFAQAAPPEYPPCAATEGVNLMWYLRKPLTDSMLHNMVARTDSLLDQFPVFAAVWRSDVRARVLDKTAPRCGFNDTLTLHLPKTTVVKIAIGKSGFEFDFSTFLGQTRIQWNQFSVYAKRSLADIHWKQEVLDMQAKTILMRSNFSDPPETILIGTDGDKITSIDVKRAGKHYGLQYLDVSGEPSFYLPQYDSPDLRAVHPEDSKDAAIFQHEGSLLYRKAFQSYYPMPKAMQSFAFSFEATIPYQRPFAAK